ncbi:MAG: hypothetical protein NVSMB26_09470 [Beijerinckiaceae bacterium]
MKRWHIRPALARRKAEERAGAASAGRARKPHPRSHFRYAHAEIEWETQMAKGQKRSSREQKKPKQNKPKEAAPAALLGAHSAKGGQKQAGSKK